MLFCSRSRGRRAALAAIMLATLLAACGSDSTSEAVTAAPEVEATASVAPVTDVPDTTEDAPTSEAAPTEAPAPTATEVPDENEETDSAGPDFESGNWLAVRRITQNRDYFTGPIAVETRRYELICVDDRCATIDGRGGPIATSDADLMPVTFLWDGETLTFGDPVEMFPCLSVSSGEFDGPETTASTAELVAHPSPDFPESVLEGTFTVEYVNPGSAECEPEDIGYDAEMYMFDATEVMTIEAPEAVFSGESVELGVEHALRPCTPSEGCDVMVRESLTWVLAAGDKRVFVDIPLTRQPDGTYEGSTTFVEPCVSDLDRSPVVDEGYTTTQSIRVNVVDVGEPLMMSYARLVGTPLATLSPEQAAVCAPFDAEFPFAGLITESPAIIDWSEPAVVPVEN